MDLPSAPKSESTVDGLAELAELAFDLRSAWNHGADTLWQQLDPDMWRETTNPWLTLQNASRARVRELWATPSFR